LDLTMRLAEDIAERLGEVPGVAAVVLGGSQARGEARPNSDVDLGLYYLPDIPPVVEDLRRLARDLDDRRLPDLATDIGAWGALDQRRWLVAGVRPTGGLALPRCWQGPGYH
jgi:predicted nucleotidyltransferase